MQSSIEQVTETYRKYQSAQGSKTPMKWFQGFEVWEMIAIRIPADGHCLFHAICMAYYPPYLESNDKKRLDVVMTMRKQLSALLTTVIDGKMIYDTLYNGSLAEQAKSGVEQYSLISMITTLNSSQFVGYGYIELISRAIKKDIYILFEGTHDVYPSDEQLYSAIGNNSSIILCYSEHKVEDGRLVGHFTLVGIKAINGVVYTQFRPDFSLVTFIRRRLKNKTQSS